jgi:hypothetical protein
MIRVGSSLLGLLVAGKLDKCTSVGCYPLFYVVRCFKDEAVWCARCCNEATDPDAVIIACDANWEDPDLRCDACSDRIESAYAEDAADPSESPACGHSACRQHYIDTGSSECVEDDGNPANELDSIEEEDRTP